MTAKILPFAPSLRARLEAIATAPGEWPRCKTCGCYADGNEVELRMIRGQPQCLECNTWEENRDE